MHNSIIYAQFSSNKFMFVCIFVKVSFKYFVTECSYIMSINKNRPYIVATGILRNTDFKEVTMVLSC